MNRTIRQLLLTFLVGGGVAAGFIGFRAWRAGTIARQEQAALASAERCLKEGKPAEALVLVEAFAKPTVSEAWQRLELRALAAAQNLPRLAILFDQDSARVLESEEASVILARAFLHSRKSAEFNRVRGAWRNRERHPDAWLALDAAVTPRFRWRAWWLVLAVAWMPGLGWFLGGLPGSAVAWLRIGLALAALAGLCETPNRLWGKGG